MGVGRRFLPVSTMRIFKRKGAGWLDMVAGCLPFGGGPACLKGLPLPCFGD